MATSQFRIAVIAGDGIGREVIPAGMAALEAVARGSGTTLSFTELPWGCEFYLKHRRMIEEGGFERVVAGGKVRTPDLGGRATTAEMARAIAGEI